MRHKIDSLPKNMMEDVLVKTLEGDKKVEEGSAQVNILQLLEMTNQQSYIYVCMFKNKKLITSDFINCIF